jgi:uncharacterized membrane protein YphA (DoxX/SURF4 family)
MAIQSLRVGLDDWFVRNVNKFKVVLRVLFGTFWLIDGALKFQPGFIDAFSGTVTTSGQPAWLAGWFSFWASAISSNTAFFVYSTGVLEVAIGACLILGLMRKLAYTASFLVGLLVWSVPEGFGGPYAAGTTDIGTGIVYALASLLFLVVSAAFGPSPYSLDLQIEKRLPGWKKIAEVRSS